MDFFVLENDDEVVRRELERQLKKLTTRVEFPPSWKHLDHDPKAGFTEPAELTCNGGPTERSREEVAMADPSHVEVRQFDPPKSGLNPNAIEFKPMGCTSQLQQITPQGSAMPGIQITMGQNLPKYPPNQPIVPAIHPLMPEQQRLTLTQPAQVNPVGEALQQYQMALPYVELSQPHMQQAPMPQTMRFQQPVHDPRPPGRQSNRGGSLPPQPPYTPRQTYVSPTYMQSVPPAQPAPQVQLLKRDKPTPPALAPLPPKESSSVAPASTDLPVSGGVRVSSMSASGRVVPGSAMPGSAMSGSAMPGSAMPGSSMSVSSGPTNSGPGSSGPASSGPGSSGPASSGPGSSGPASSGPGSSGPASSGPGSSGPASSGPASSGPASSVTSGGVSSVSSSTASTFTIQFGEFNDINVLKSTSSDNDRVFIYPPKTGSVTKSAVASRPSGVSQEKSPVSKPLTTSAPATSAPTTQPTVKQQPSATKTTPVTSKPHAAAQPPPAVPVSHVAEVTPSAATPAASTPHSVRVNESSLVSRSQTTPSTATAPIADLSAASSPPVRDTVSADGEQVKANGLTNGPSLTSNVSSVDVSLATKSWASLLYSNSASPHPAKPSMPLTECKKEEVVPVATNGDINEAGAIFSKLELNQMPIPLQARRLRNQANWCYVNATLQALLACPPFYHALKALPDYPALSKHKSKTPVLDAMVEFVKQFQVLTTPDKQTEKRRSKRENIHGDPFEPSSVYDVLDMMKTSESTFQRGKQEDAEEFLTCLLNKMHEEIAEAIKQNEKSSMPESIANGHGVSDSDHDSADDGGWEQVGTKNKSVVTHSNVDKTNTPILEIFGGKLRASLSTSSASLKESAMLEQFFTVPLNVEASSVEEALHAFVSKEVIDGYTCPDTNQELDAHRRLSFESLPPILILHLKCFVYDKHGGSLKVMHNVKFRDTLEFDKDLLTRFVSVPRHHRYYRLFAVVYHSGTKTTGGHYHTDVYHTAHRGWMRFDDNASTPISLSDVLTPKNPCVPYLLYYKRTEAPPTSAASQ